jgi:hypothetical protein
VLEQHLPSCRYSIVKPRRSPISIALCNGWGVALQTHFINCRTTPHCKTDCVCGDGFPTRIESFHFVRSSPGERPWIVRLTEHATLRLHESRKNPLFRRSSIIRLTRVQKTARAKSLLEVTSEIQDMTDLDGLDLSRRMIHKQLARLFEYPLSTIEDCCLQAN